MAEINRGTGWGVPMMMVRKVLYYSYLKSALRE